MANSAATKKDMTWKDAIIAVLKSAGKAMHYVDIATEIQQQGLRLKVGATPASAVNVVLHDSIKNEATNSPFVKVGTGEFFLKATPSQNAVIPAGQAKAIGEDEESGGIIKAFGMYWRRNWVEWSTKPSLMGQQFEGADSVNFADQTGVYLLHDGREVVYVGRTTEKRIAARLSEHTRDRLNGRWDRFSWFGVLDVTDEGKLGAANFAVVTEEDIIVTLEALLIEGLEPRQNRRRGDAFRAVEYLQVEDPELVKKNEKLLAAKMLSKIGS